MDMQDYNILIYILYTPPPHTYKDPSKLKKNYLTSIITSHEDLIPCKLKSLESFALCVLEVI